MTSNKKLVFACSLQQDIVSKIKSDIKVICKGPGLVDGIFYFCDTDIPVGKRHRLQQWVYEEYKTELEIIDGQALSEQLTNHDLFWIAVEYLDVPAEFYPRFGLTNEIYEKYKIRWLVENNQPFSHRDFFEIKYGLRRATFSNEAKSDLTKWLNKIELFLDTQFPIDLRRRATYEICVAALRGLNNLTERKALVESYFSSFDNLRNGSDIEDATTLLSYCSSAQLYKHFDIEAEKLHQWSVRLIGIIEQALDATTNVGERCRLLQTRGQAAYLQYGKGITPQFDTKETFYWWARLLNEVENAPLFPLENFADLLTLMTKFVGDDVDFIELTKKTDLLLTQRSSGYIAAEKCRDRAISYYEIEKYLQSIKQFHEAKIKWFSAETLKGSLLSMLILSDCYQKLGLLYPAKYYAAGVAFISHVQDDPDIKSFLPRALFVLADCCYLAGEWLNYANIAKWALMAHRIYDEYPCDITRHENLKHLYVYTAIIRTVTGRFDMDLAAAFDEIFIDWPIDKETADAVKNLSDDPSGYWQKVSPEEIWQAVQEQLHGRPFSDTGGKRGIYWKALGIEWAVEFDNEYFAVSITEQFVSTLQVILADLANKDLVLLPTKVLIKANIIYDKQISITEEPSNRLATWSVGFPKEWIKNKDTLDEMNMSVLSVAVAILANCSLLDVESIHKIIKNAFSDGLPAKIFSVRPYSELYTEFFLEKDFYSPNRKELNGLFPSLDYSLKEHPQLAWVNSDGPGYSKDRSREFLTNRYKNAIKQIRLTLQRLLHDAQFLEIINDLKSAKYLDWEILLLVANISIDYRVKLLLPSNAGPEAQIALMKELMLRNESEQDPHIPAHIFTKDRIEIQKKVLTATVAKTWGLIVHRQTPDFDALELLLDARFHNSEDDIEHEEFFELKNQIGP